MVVHLHNTALILELIKVPEATQGPVVVWNVAQINCSVLKAFG